MLHTAELYRKNHLSIQAAFPVPIVSQKRYTPYATNRSLKPLKSNLLRQMSLLNQFEFEVLPANQIEFPAIEKHGFPPNPTVRPCLCNRFACKSLQHPGNLLQVSRCGLCLGGKAAMLAGVPIADGWARVIAAVHPASPLPLHGWRLALHSQAGPGKAARGVGQPLRLHGIVCQNFHFPHSPHDGGIGRQ